MELSRLASAWRRRWWIFVLAVVIGVGLGFVVFALQTPMYTATARLFISTTGGTSSTESYSGEQFSQQRTASYAQIITSELITQQVVNDLQLNMSAGELSSHITATVVPRTVLMDVSVVDTSPRRAADIANSLVQKFTDFVVPLETPVGQQQPRSTISVVKAAEPPSSASSPLLATNLFYGALGGLVVGSAIILGSAAFGRRIRSSGELQSLTGPPVLGPIESVNRNPEQWQRRFVAQSHGDAEADATRRIRVQIEARDSTPQVILLVPASNRASALNTGLDLCASYAEAGRRTALVCADPSTASIVSRLGTSTSDRGLSDLLTEDVSYDDIRMTTQNPALVLVPPGTSADVASMVSSPLMKSYVGDLRAEFDKVVVVSPSINRNSGATVLSSIADAALLVVDAKVASRKDVRNAVGELKSVRATVIGTILVDPRR